MSKQAFLISVLLWIAILGSGIALGLLLALP